MAPQSSLSTIRPEEKLLVHCARVSMDADQTGGLSGLLQEEVDWSYLREAATQHGMMPLVYYHLNSSFRHAVPQDFLDQLRSDFHQNAASNLFLAGELLKILNLFEAEGLPVIAFKGPTLAVLAYKNLLLRHAGDLDIMVRKKDVPRARKILISQQYEPQFDLTDAQEEAYIKFTCEHAFVRNDIMLMVDLHWGIVPSRFSFAPDVEALWDQPCKVSIRGNYIPTVCPEELLLLLCVHGAKHYWSRLSMVCDLSELIRAHKQMDWTRVTEQARASSSERMLLLGLFLAQDLLGASLPDDISQSVKSAPRIRSLAAQVYTMLFPKSEKGAGIIKEHLFYMKAMDSLRDRFRFCFDLFRPTPLEWRLLPLPPSLSLLYYLVRPVRLTGKYTGKLLRRLTSGGKKSDG